MLVFNFSEDKIQIFDHSLTDNEIAKQHLLSILDTQKPDEFDNFIKENPNSRYVSVAQQKKLDCIQKRWNTISNPSNYSVSHIHQVEEYIEKYGTEVSVAAAQTELNNLYKLAYQNIDKNNSLSLENYISSYPRSPQLNQAEQRLKTVYKTEYNNLCSHNDLDAYLDYANNHPKSPYLYDINSRASSIQQKQEAERQRIKAEEERRKQEEILKNNAAKLDCVGRTIYWTENVSFDISSGNEGWLSSIISDKLGTNKVTYNVKYYAIVEATLGNTAVKCVISNVQIIDPRFASANYIKYKSSAMSTLSNDIGKTRVKQVNEFELQ